MTAGKEKVKMKEMLGRGRVLRIMAVQTPHGWIGFLESPEIYIKAVSHARGGKDRS